MQRDEIHSIRTSIFLKKRKVFVETFFFVSDEYKFLILAAAVTATVSYESLKCRISMVGVDS